MTILNESGIPDVLPPLHAANSLAEKMPTTLVVVLGTRSEAFVTQSLPAPPAPGYSSPPRSPRVIFMVLGESDATEQGYVASRIVEAAAGFRRLEAVFVVSGLSTQKLGVEAEFEARLAERRLEIPVEAIDPDSPRESPGVLATDLEDRITAALLAMCPEQSSSELVEKPNPEKQSRSLLGGFLGRDRDEEYDDEASPVVLAGAFGSAVSGRELASEMRRAGLTVAGSVPSARMRDLPDMGENTVVALMDANLSETARAAEERGARVVKTLMPVGVDGTARFIQEVAAAAGENVSELSKARSVWEDFHDLRNRVRGKRLFFAGDTGMELPLARFLADAGRSSSKSGFRGSTGNCFSRKYRLSGRAWMWSSRRTGGGKCKGSKTRGPIASSRARVSSLRSSREATFAASRATSPAWGRTDTPGRGGFWIPSTEPSSGPRGSTTRSGCDG